MELTNFLVLFIVYFLCMICFYKLARHYGIKYKDALQGLRYMTEFDAGYQSLIIQVKDARLLLVLFELLVVFSIYKLCGALNNVFTYLSVS